MEMSEKWSNVVMKFQFKFKNYIMDTFLNFSNLQNQAFPHFHTPKR